MKYIMPPAQTCLDCEGTGKDKDSLRYDYEAFPDFCPTCLGCGVMPRWQPCIQIKPQVT